MIAATFCLYNFCAAGMMGGQASPGLRGGLCFFLRRRGVLFYYFWVTWSPDIWRLGRNREPPGYFLAGWEGDGDG